MLNDKHLEFSNIMLGPSGFFLPDGPGTIQSDSDEIELIHTSKDGFNELYRICKNGRFFVYKALKKEYRGNLLYEELLKKDFNIGFSLNHSNVCQYYAKIEHPEVGNCIVMEWIDGCTLQELLTESNLDNTLAKKIICELCEAIDYIHRKQVIHRDLKPENILITHNGRNVKVIDFGLADADSYNTFKAPAGTRIYASPELVAGESVDSRSDIWSLGMIISELSTKYRHVVKRCLSTDRNKRYGTASEVKKAILNEANRKIRNALGIIAAVLCIAAVGFFIFQNNSASSTNRPPVIELSDTDSLIVSDTTIQDAMPPVRTTPKLHTEQKPEELRTTPAPLNDSIDANGLDALFKEAADLIL